MGLVAGDGDVAGAAGCTLVAVAAAADACTMGAAGGVHGAAGDGDVVGGSGITAADACTAILAGGNDLGVIAGDDDIVGTAVMTAADTGTAVSIKVVSLTAGGVHCAAGDGDVVALAESTAADAGTAAHGATAGVAAGSGSDVAAGDGDVAAASGTCTADACAARAAGGGQRAVGILCVDGQGAVLGRFTAVGVVLFQTCMSGTADEGVVSLQLDLGVAGTRHGHGSLAVVADVDVHILQRDLGSAVFLRLDGDSILRSGAAVLVRDDRFTLVLMILDFTLCNVVAIFFGNDADASIFHVVGVRKGRRGNGRDHCHQRSCRKYPQGQLLFGFGSHT